MGVLSERLKNNAESLKKRKAELEETIAEWVTALNSLYSQLESWLQLCDPENLIDRAIEQMPGRDPSLGEHQVPVLRLTLLDDTIRFQPRSRYMAALITPPGSTQQKRVDGAVELVGSAGRTHYLFRVNKEWFVQNDSGSNLGKSLDAVPLTQELFEKIVQETFYEIA